MFSLKENNCVSLINSNMCNLDMQVSFLAVDDLFPDWKIWNQFIDTTVSAFRLDGLIESHPIEVFCPSVYF